MRKDVQDHSCKRSFRVLYTGSPSKGKKVGIMIKFTASVRALNDLQE